MYDSVSLSIFLKKFAHCLLLPGLSLAAACLPANESKALNAAASVQLPSRGLPPTGTARLGFLLLSLSHCRADLYLVLVAVPDQVMQTTALLILYRQIKTASA
jgi:hypothetical protein